LLPRLLVLRPRDDAEVDLLVERERLFRDCAMGTPCGGHTEYNP